MYKSKKFRMRSMQEIKEDIAEAARHYPLLRRVFLADGDALALNQGALLEVLENLYASFPRLERVGIYANPHNILEKGEAQLAQLRREGLHILYLGIESGSAKVLADVRKGATPEEMVQAGKKALEAGFLLSVTVILGLAGREGSRQHALETARVVSAINPQYLGALTLMLNRHAPLLRKAERGEFQPLDPQEILMEQETLIAHLETKGCVFRSNHASNYLSLKGTLKEDREKLLQQIQRAKENPAFWRQESMRRL
jgi:radical SAM superfamily enzyme YgiQ (UPF0313 family)